MKLFCSVSHPRSGIHWTLRTIFANFKTPYSEYLQMFGTHELDMAKLQQKKPDACILHVARDIQFVLMSVFRMRERNGISSQFDFHNFLRTKYCDMPKTHKQTTMMFFEQSRKTQSARSWIQQQPHTPPELWLLTNLYWRKLGITTVTYEQMKQDQQSVMDVVQQMTKWESKKPTTITKTVGWHPPNNNSFEVSDVDKKLIDDFRKRFDTEMNS